MPPPLRDEHFDQRSSTTTDPRKTFHDAPESPCPTRAPCPRPPSRCCREAGYAVRRDPQASSIVADPRNDVEFFYLAPPRHRDLRRLRRPRRRHHRPRPAARLALAGDRGRRPRLRRLHVPLRRPGGRLRRAVRPRAACASATSVLRASSATSSTRQRRGGDRRAPRRRGGVRGAARAWRMPWPTWSRPAPRSARQGLEIFGPVILESDRRAHRRSRAGSRAGDLPPPPAGRHGRAPLRAHGLRPARPTSSSRRRAITPGFESPTVSPLRDTGWVAVRVDGAARGHQPRHGRAVRARRARHPGHRDPRREDLMAVACEVVRAVRSASSRASTSPTDAS